MKEDLVTSFPCAEDVTRKSIECMPLLKDRLVYVLADCNDSGSLWMYL
jgi:hypothetical protein